MNLTLTMTFGCCRCGNDITAKLACTGKGLGFRGGPAVAAVCLPCPHCGEVCQLLFDPHRQAVCEVRPYWESTPMPVPSWN